MSIPGNTFFGDEPLHMRSLPGIPEVKNSIPYEIYRRPNYTSENDGWRHVSNRHSKGGWRGRKAHATAEAVKNLILM